MATGLDERLARLQRAELTVLGRFADASNATLLVHVRDAGEPAVAAGTVAIDDLPDDQLAVYKPRRGEAPLWDFPDGTLHLREAAAFEVDRLLGFGMVPPTIVRHDAPHGTGSVQQYVRHDPAKHWFWIREHLDDDLLAQAQRLVAFDLIVENADRKGGHVLLDAAGRMWLVDHGVCFHPDPHVRTVVWDLAGTPVPGAVRDTAARLAEGLAADGESRTRLAALLTDDEVEVTRRRAARVAEMSRYPEPTGPRPYPWPPL